MTETGAAGGTVGTGQLPSGFPESFPLPDGSTPVYSYGGPDGMFVWFSSPSSYDDIKGFFVDNLPPGGWSIDSQAEYSGPDGAVLTLSLSGEGWSGVLVVGKGDAAAGGFAGDFAFYVSLTPASA